MSQYAEVVPNTKTDLLTQTFTYKVPPEILPQIKVGSLVYIPFGKRKIEGIIIDFKKKLPQRAKAKEIKEIIKILETEIVDKIQIELAKWMAEYFLAPLSLCLFEMVALPPKRKDKEYRIKEQGFTNLLPEYSHLFPIFKLCQRALEKNRQTLILFPEINLARRSLPLFQKKFKKLVFYHGELNKKERFQAWQEIKKGQVDIVIGSRLSLFLPLSRLGLIIIIDEGSEAYKNERSPRYNAKIVAERLVKLRNAKLVLTGPASSVESFFQAQKKQLYLLSVDFPQKKPKSYLIDMRKEIQKRNPSPLSEVLQNALKTVYKNGGRSILFVSRRGASPYIFCRDCGYVLRCPNCDLPLTYHLSDGNHGLFCHHCSFKTKPPSLCPNCQGPNLKYWGVGTQKIETEIKKLFIKPEILKIEKDYQKARGEIEGEKDAEIIIGTQKLFSNWFEAVELVAVVSVDSSLHLPDFRQGEKTFSVLKRLKSLAKNLFLVQTYHPENSIIKVALKGDYIGFYQKELESRKKLNFPPFSKLIRILYQHKNENICRKKIEFFTEKLSSLISNSQFPITILGPSPCFYSKIRGKFRWQTIIKTQNSKVKSQNLPSKITELLKTLPDDWIIDVEPATLL